jgi:hypothetical protein
MTIGIRLKLPGITQDQFDAVQEHVNPERNPPKGPCVPLVRPD